MNADQLYEEIKSALRYFDLKWPEKNKIKVEIFLGKIQFSYLNRLVVVDPTKFTNSKEENK